MRLLCLIKHDWQIIRESKGAGGVFGYWLRIFPEEIRGYEEYTDRFKEPSIHLVEKAQDKICRRCEKIVREIPAAIQKWKRQMDKINKKRKEDEVKRLQDEERYGRFRRLGKLGFNGQ